MAAQAATNIASAGTTWAGATWSLGTVPTNSDDVVINSGVNLTIGTSAVCGSLTIGNATKTATTLTVGAGGSLTVTTAGGGTGHLSINPSNVGANMTLAVGAQSATIDGTVTLSSTNTQTISVSSGSVSFTRSGGLTWSAGILTLSGAGTVTFGGLLTQSGGTIQNNTTAGTMDFQGGYAKSAGTFTTMAGETVKFGGSLTVSGTALTLNATSLAQFNGSGTVTPTAAITFGNVLIDSGATVTLAGSVAVAGNWTNNGGTLSGGSNMVTFSGAGKTIGGTGSTAFPNMTIASGATYSLDTGTTNSCNDLVFAASATASSLTHIGSAAFSVGGNLTIHQPTAAVTTAWNINAGTGSVTGTSTIGGTNNTATWVARVAVTSGTATFNGTVTLSTGSSSASGAISVGTGTLTFAAALTHNEGTLTFTDTGTMNFNGGYAFASGGSVAPVFTTVSGSNLNFGGALTASATGGLTLHGSSNSTFTGSGNITPTTNLALGNVTVNNGVTATTVSAAGNCTIAGNLLLSGTGTLAGTEPVLLTGAGATLDGTGTLSAASTVSANHTVNTTANLTISGTMTINSGITVTNNGTVTAGDLGAATGTWLQNAGTAVLNYSGSSITPTLTATAAGNRVNYNAAGAQTVKATTYHHLELSNSGTKTFAASAVTIEGDFTISGTAAGAAAAALTVNGNTSVASGAAFNAGSYTHTVKGNYVDAGTASNYGTSTIVVNGTSAQNLSIYITAYNLTVNNLSGVTLTGKVGCGHTLTLTAGRVTLGVNNFTLGFGATISGASSSSYLVTDSTGTLVRYGVNTSGLNFPIGTTTSYLPLTAKTGDASGGGVAARVTGSVTPPFSDNAKAVQATWITSVASVDKSPTEFTFQWNASDEGASFVRANSSVFRYSSSWQPAGTTTVAGSNPYTATVTGVSQYGSYIVANGGALSGKVFEDVNYGGGAGRNWATASGNGGSPRSGARVELFNNSGTFVTSTTTDGSGNYTFSGVNAGSYTVRVVTGSVTSSRTGFTTSCLPVLTYRTNASTGTAVDVTDYVGGHDPATTDAGDAASGWVLNNSTGAFSGSGSGKAHAFAPVLIGAADTTGVDFGWNFNTIVNANNSGQGSLRQFLTNANTLGGDAALSQSGLVTGKENAVFMISNGTTAAGLRSSNNYFSSGVATISPTSALPAISAAVVLDAQKQPGWTAAPIIELNGAGAGWVAGFDISAGNSIVGGFVINRFGLYGIRLSTGGVNVIQGNYLGTNATGTVKAGNQKGIMISGGSASNTVGGSASSQRNILSGNTGEGLYIQDAGSDANIVKGNYIGTDASGTVALGNNEGIGIHSASKSNVIGGAAAGEGNVIAGNSGFGVWMSGPGTDGHTFLGNRIGTDLSGTLNLGNTSDGIYVSAGPRSLTIGGRAAGEGNVIAFNGGKGINLYSFGNGVTSDRISGNSIFSNAGLGIDLENDGQTPNDGAKTGGKANMLMDYPVFTAATLSGTTLTVAGYVGSAPGQSTFGNAAVEIFKSDNDSSGYGEGKTYLGYLTADANGNFSGTLTVSGLALGDKITGTATDGSNNTSEFGLNATVIDFVTITAVKASVVISDPVNNTTNPKRIPGAVIEYSIMCANTNNGSPDTNTVVITDAIDSARLAFGAAAGVTFVDGVPSSGLTLGAVTYSSTAAPGPYVYNYTPVPDGNGYDGAVTSVRIATTGVFAYGGSPAPGFTVKFRVKIK